MKQTETILVYAGFMHDLEDFFMFFVSTTFLNLQKLSGPAYTDAAFSLSITNSEAFAETLGLILGGNAFPKLFKILYFMYFLL